MIVKNRQVKKIPTADTYCVQCKHKLCGECHIEHTRFKATRNHKLTPINDYKCDRNQTTDLATSICEIHEQTILNIYCSDCKTVMCAICFIEEHKDHDGSHVNKYLDGFQKQIQNHTEAVNVCISQAQKRKVELLRVITDIQERVESIECDVEKRKEEIKQLTDKHSNCLLQSLCSERRSVLKKIQTATDEVDAYLSNLESYNSYCQRIMAKGSASDICRAISDLSVRAMELQQQCQPIIVIECGIQEFKFRFRQSAIEEFIEEDCRNLIGEIEGDVCVNHHLNYM